MNPIIICQKPVNGCIEIPLDSSCDCLIGLVSISLPPIDTNGNLSEIFVSCDQVDATLCNGKRWLRVFGYDSRQSQQWAVFKFNTVLYHNIDSSEKKLTFHIYNKSGPIVPKDEKSNSDKIIMELNLIPSKQMKNL